VTSPESRALTLEAERLAAIGNLTDALERMHDAYHLEPSAYRASGILRISRKAGLDEAAHALDLGREALAKWPDDVWLQRGFAWCLWSVWLKPADQQVKDDRPLSPQAWVDVQDAVREIASLHLPAGDVAKEQSFLVAARLAKTMADWPFVLELIEWFPEDSCGTESRTHEGRSLPSPREQWWGWSVRALLGTDQPDKALEHAKRAIAIYPNSLPLRRLEALALQETGAYEAALETLRFLQARQPRQWYLAADLSKALDAAGQRQEATSWALACLGMPGPIEGRIRIMERSTTWLAEAGHMDAARETCVLAWILAQQHQWERRTRATEALMTQWGWSRPAKTPRLQDQLQIARSHWTTHGGAKPRLSNPDSLDPARTVDQDQQRLGTIAQWHADRGYGFVRDQSGGMHFFLLRDAKGIPGGPISGMRVTCKIEPSFDRKKGKPSTAARNLMPSPDDERM